MTTTKGNAQMNIAILTAHGLSLPEIARLAAVSHKSIVTAWSEGKKNPQLRASCRLAQAAEMPPRILEQMGSKNHVAHVREFFSRHFDALEGMNPIAFISRYGEARPEDLLLAIKIFAEAVFDT